MGASKAQYTLIYEVIIRSVALKTNGTYCSVPSTPLAEKGLRSRWEHGLSIAENQRQILFIMRVSTANHPCSVLRIANSHKILHHNAFIAHDNLPFFYRDRTLVFLTAKGLSSAVLFGSKVNRVETYNPRNRTIVAGSPLPCANDAGAENSCPKLILGMLGMLGPVAATLLAPAPSLPSVWPLLLKTGLCFAGPLAASAAAERIAERRADGLAPRTVSTTLEPLRTRKVGILAWPVSWVLGRLPGRFGGVLRRDAVARGYLALVVHVDLCERDTAWLRFLRSELLEDRRYDLARPTPICVEVDHEVCRRLESLGEVSR